MGTAFIHLHPQNSYLAKCLWHLEHVKSWKPSNTELVLFAGPCFLTYMMHQYSLYLEQNKDFLLQRYCSVKIIRPPDLLTQSITSFTSCKLNNHDSAHLSSLNLSEQILLDNSVSDSVHRNLWPGLDIRVFHTMLATSSAGASQVLRLREDIFHSLYMFYKSHMSCDKSSHAYMSHHSYDFYASFYLASTHSHASFTHVHGGHQIMYDIGFISPYGIGKDAPIKTLGANCGQLLKNSLLKLHSYNCSTTRTASLDSRFSATNLITDPSTTTPGKKASLIIVVPVLSEIQFEIMDTLRNFNSRLDYLSYTLSSIQSNSYQHIIVRMHPACNDYGEADLVYQYIKEFTQHLSGNLHICRSHDDFKLAVAANDVSLSSSKWVLFQGSMSLELPSKGIKPICAVTPVSPSSSYIYPRSLQQYTALINDPSYISTLSPDMINLCSDLVSFDNSVSRGSEADFIFKQFDDTYHFGNIRNPDISLFSYLLDQLPSKMSHDAIPAGAFTIYRFSLTK